MSASQATMKTALDDKIYRKLDSLHVFIPKRSARTKYLTCIRSDQLIA